MMRRAIVLANAPFELVTSDWPFEDDEACCLDLAEALFSQLEDQLDLELDLDRVLRESMSAAAADYGMGVNAFACQLELRPLTESVYR
ncbi:MAG: hypothetical protein JWN80_2909 [Microbacteriaceae bacterium]|nr:hypothetical protein [Microbacteriaceae bacterium]